MVRWGFMAQGPYRYMLHQTKNNKLMLARLNQHQNIVNDKNKNIDLSYVDGVPIQIQSGKIIINSNVFKRYKLSMLTKMIQYI